MIEQQNGTPPEAVARVFIVMKPDGSIACRYEGPTKEIFLMMMESAKFDMMAKLQQPVQTVVAPPPGMQVPRYP